MKTIRVLPLWFTTLLLGACVTINIYFPAAAAEKAADRIIEGVWGEKPAGAPSGGEEGQPQSPTPPRDAPSPQSRDERPGVWVAALDWLIPPARAAEPDLNINTPAIRSLRDAMQARHRQLEPHYGSGALGLDRQGLLTVRDPAAVALRQRNEVKQLVDQENQDRNRLYREIAQANGHPEWEARVRATFADRWRVNAHSGWWCQASDGRWYKK
ncbi:YdbL family probable chaperone protein [Endothiovibrio diazotrophicus]